MSESSKEDVSSKHGRLSSERLNLVIAICAILISAASFYATYLQAESARQQVKAMTYPYVQFLHGNYDTEKQQTSIQLELKNSGVGPAIIKSLSIGYEQRTYADVNQWIKACCPEEFKQMMKNKDSTVGALSVADLTTSEFKNLTLPMTESVELLRLGYDEKNKALWSRLNRERWKLKVSICYCSILGDCYLGDNLGAVNEVKQCQ